MSRIAILTLRPAVIKVDRRGDHINASLESHIESRNHDIVCNVATTARHLPHCKVVLSAVAQTCQESKVNYLVLNIKIVTSIFLMEDRKELANLTRMGQLFKGSLTSQSCIWNDTSEVVRVWIGSNNSTDMGTMAIAIHRI